MRAQDGAESAPGMDTGRAPFPGLEAFQGEDAPFFFGRRVEALRALQRFGPTPSGAYHRWLQVEGGSGSPVAWMPRSRIQVFRCRSSPDAAAAPCRFTRQPHDVHPC